MTLLKGTGGRLEQTADAVCSGNEAPLNHILFRTSGAGGEASSKSESYGTDMILALCDGLWLSLLLSPDQTSRRDAHDSILRLLAMLFPKHFPR